MQALLDVPQPDVVWRMGVIHAVSVLEAYLMYCARALLNDDLPLIRFRDAFFFHSAKVSGNDKKLAPVSEISLFRPVARQLVSKLSFHNMKTIINYFPPYFCLPSTGCRRCWMLSSAGVRLSFTATASRRPTTLSMLAGISFKRQSGT